MNIITDHFWGRRKESNQEEDIFANGRVVLHDQLQVKGNLHRGLNQQQFSSFLPVALISQANEEGNTTYTLAIASYRIPLTPSMGLKPTLPKFLEEEKIFQELAGKAAAETLSAVTTMSTETTEAENTTNTTNNKPPVIRESRVLRRNSSFSFLQSLSRSRSSTPTPRNNNTTHSNHSSRHTSPSPQERTSRSGSFSFAFANAFSLSSSFDNNNTNNTNNNNSLSITDSDLLLQSPPPSSSTIETALPTHFSLTVTAKDHRYITLQTSELSVWQRWHAALREALADLLFGRVFQMIPTHSNNSVNNNNNKDNNNKTGSELSVKRLEIGLRRGPLLLPPAHCHLLRVKRLRNLKVDLNESFERLMHNKLSLSREEVGQLVKRAEIDRLLMSDHVYATLKDWVKDTGSGLLTEKELFLLKTHENIPLTLTINENNNSNNMDTSDNMKNVMGNSESNVVKSPKILIDRHSINSIQSPLVSHNNITCDNKCDNINNNDNNIANNTINNVTDTNTSIVHDSVVLEKEEELDSNALFLASISSPRTTERIFARHFYSDEDRLFDNIIANNTDKHDNKSNMTYSDSSKSSCQSVKTLHNNYETSINISPDLSDNGFLDKEEPKLETESIVKTLFVTEKENADNSNNYALNTVINSTNISNNDICNKDEMAGTEENYNDAANAEERSSSTEESESEIANLPVLLPHVSISPTNHHSNTVENNDDTKFETLPLIDNMVHKQYQRCLLQLSRSFKSPSKPTSTLLGAIYNDSVTNVVQGKVHFIEISQVKNTEESVNNDDNMDVGIRNNDVGDNYINEDITRDNNNNDCCRTRVDNETVDVNMETENIIINHDNASTIVNDTEHHFLENDKTFSSNDNSETALSDCQFQYYYVTPPSTSIDLSLISPIGAVTTPTVDDNTNKILLHINNSINHTNNIVISIKDQETQVTPSLQKGCHLAAETTHVEVSDIKQVTNTVLLEDNNSGNNQDIDSADNKSKTDTEDNKNHMMDANNDINNDFNNNNDVEDIDVKSVDNDDNILDLKDINERISSSINTTKSPKYRYDTDNIADDAEEESNNHVINSVVPFSSTMTENNHTFYHSPNTDSFIFHVSPCSTSVLSPDNNSNNNFGTENSACNSEMTQLSAVSDIQCSSNENGLAILAAISSSFMSPPQKQPEANNFIDSGVVVAVSDSTINISPLTPDSVTDTNNIVINSLINNNISNADNNNTVIASTNVHEDCSTSTDDLPGYLSKKMQFQPAELQQIDEVLELLDELSQSASISSSQRTRHTHHFSENATTNNISFISSEENTCAFPVPHYSHLHCSYPTHSSNGMYSSTGSVSSMSMLSTGSHSHCHSHSGHYYVNHPYPPPHALPGYTQQICPVPYYLQTYPYPSSPDMYAPPPLMPGAHTGHMVEASDCNKHDVSDVQSLNYSQSIIVENHNNNIINNTHDGNNNSSIYYNRAMMDSPPKMPWDASFYASPIHSNSKHNDCEEEKEVEDILDVSDIFDRLSLQNNNSKNSIVGSPVRNTTSTTAASLRKTVSTLSPLKQPSPKTKQNIFKGNSVHNNSNEVNDSLENEKYVGNVSDFSDNETSKHETSHQQSSKKTKQAPSTTKRLPKLSSSSLDNEIETREIKLDISSMKSPERGVFSTSLSPLLSPDSNSHLADDSDQNTGNNNKNIVEKLKSRTFRQELSSTKQRVNELTDKIHRMRSKLLSQEEPLDGIYSGNNSLNVSFSCTSPIIKREISEAKEREVVSDLTMVRTLDVEQMNNVVINNNNDMVMNDTDYEKGKERLVFVEKNNDFTITNASNNKDTAGILKEVPKQSIIQTAGSYWKLCTSMLVIGVAIWLFMMHPLCHQHVHHNALKLTDSNNNYGVTGRYSVLQSKPYHFEYISSTLNTSDVYFSVSRSHNTSDDKTETHVIMFKSKAVFNSASKELSLPMLPLSFSEKKHREVILMKQLFLKSKALELYQKWAKQIRPLELLKTVKQKLKQGVFNLWRGVVVKVTLMPKEHQQLLFENN